MALSPFFDRISAGKLKEVDGETVIASHFAYKQVPLVRWAGGTLYLTESTVIWIRERYTWPARAWRAARSSVRHVDVTSGFPATFRRLKIRTGGGDCTFLLDQRIWSHSPGERAEKWQALIREWADIAE